MKNFERRYQQHLDAEAKKRTPVTTRLMTVAFCWTATIGFGLAMAQILNS